MSYNVSWEVRFTCLLGGVETMDEIATTPRLQQLLSAQEFGDICIHTIERQRQEIQDD